MDTIFTDGQLVKLIKTMHQKQMTPERFNSLLRSGILADVLDQNADLGNRDAVRAALKLGIIVPDVFRLIVESGYSLEQVISNGQYGSVDSEITSKHFHIEEWSGGVVEYDARYFHFKRHILSIEAVQEIEQAGWSPAKIEHLLSHGETFPDEQRKFSIVGLGSVAEMYGDHYVSYLNKRKSERSLEINPRCITWWPNCRFLAVRKVSVT